jgi:hypothetical protein
VGFHGVPAGPEAPDLLTADVRDFFRGLTG